MIHTNPEIYPNTIDPNPDHFLSEYKNILAYEVVRQRWTVIGLYNFLEHKVCYPYWMHLPQTHGCQENPF